MAPRERFCPNPNGRKSLLSCIAEVQDYRKFDATRGKVFGCFLRQTDSPSARNNIEDITDNLDKNVREPPLREYPPKGRVREGRKFSLAGENLPPSGIGYQSG